MDVVIQKKGNLWFAGPRGFKSVLFGIGTTPFEALKALERRKNAEAWDTPILMEKSK